jgi:ribonuclease HI
MGKNKNNGKKYLAIIKGMQLAFDMDYNNLVIEGDPQIMVSAIAKIIHGTNLDKIYSNWGISSGFG